MFANNMNLVLRAPEGGMTQTTETRGFYSKEDTEIRTKSLFIVLR